MGRTMRLLIAVLLCFCAILQRKTSVVTSVCVCRPRPVTYRQKTADRLILPSDAIPTPASNPQSRPPFFSRPCNLLPSSYMPILETLSNLFTWSPRHQRPPTPDPPVQQSPLSHGISEQLQRSQSFGVDGAADLDLGFSTSGDRSETPGLLSVSAHSPDVSCAWVLHHNLVATTAD